MTTKNWAAGCTIRARRVALGLSLDHVAHALGVSKTYVSYVESDERSLTDEQARKLSSIIGMPADLLLLSAGRLPDDVREIFVSDTAGVAASIRQQKEQHAVEYPTTVTTLPSAARVGTVTPFAIPKRITVTKTKSAYRAHSYHTKVPPEAITPFIDALSQPGDTVLDLFSGSGMTGVAALSRGRNAILSDLSPAAVHISRNYNTACSVSEFRLALARVEKAVSSTMDWLYTAVANPEQRIEYTTWSDVFQCQACSGSILYWDAARNSTGIDIKGITCPHCSKVFKKSDLVWVGEQPVQTHVSSGSSRINSHNPTQSELDLIKEVDATPIPYWVPNVPFGSEREMWRASHLAMQITEVKQFFTRRNLHALAALRHAIISESEGRIREALMFAFTACVNRASRRYQWNAKRPTNVMTGTLYVSSLRYEWNVWSLFRRKAADVERYFSSFPVTDARAQVMNRSATDLSCIPNGIIPMVFMDPPFGSNIFYADSSILWEAWLGSLTDHTDEIVVNKSRGRVGGGKTLSDYGALMTRAFSEVSRVLAPNGYAVLAFSNSDDKVWIEIQKAIASANLETVTVHILDKGQPSIKGVKGVTGKEAVTTLDLLITLKHRREPTKTFDHERMASDSLIDSAVFTCIKTGGLRTDEIYTSVIQTLLSSNETLLGITMPAIANRCAKLGAVEVDGKWILRHS
ncbi:DNA methyltransferase [Massilia timonae]|uniref:DNA methyltransferase n=1 Tax=Massilia timonae TaxID=47229 RepID=UPI0023544AAE|nr:DNA methyltransferase [Massilia timonae]